MKHKEEIPEYVRACIWFTDPDVVEGYPYIPAEPRVETDLFVSGTDGVAQLRIPSIAVLRVLMDSAATGPGAIFRIRVPNSQDLNSL